MVVMSLWMLFIWMVLISVLFIWMSVIYILILWLLIESTQNEIIVTLGALEYIHTCMHACIHVYMHTCTLPYIAACTHAHDHA